VGGRGRETIINYSLKSVSKVSSFFFSTRSCSCEHSAIALDSFLDFQIVIIILSSTLETTIEANEAAPLFFVVVVG
jgi:hypothetical protein